ncbi:MAG: type II toxin-antitoxin system VapC family toxin [Microthrixaceae bacterium]
MTLFLDTTALLARYLEGPAQETALLAMNTDPDWCASALALSEALMLVDRLGDDPHRTDALRRAMRDDWERIHIVPVDQRCLDRAAELGRTQPVRTVDAIHLAAADRLPEPLTYLTFDPGQIPVALSMGFLVSSTHTALPDTASASSARLST